MSNDNANETNTMIDLPDLNDVTPLEVLSDGEYKLRVLDAEVRQAKEGTNKYINFRLEAEDEPNADDIYHMVMLPDPVNQTPKTNKKRQIALREALAAMNAPLSGSLDLEALVGTTVYAILTTEDDQRAGGKRNRVKKFVLGA